ncbi:hypothetical protein BIW11_06311 [Tropilaelaps mercedesae]|uniref:HRDC domain-containing protein n=1 Tax=Tropilaelaps mercedesae TaxID=418985 RepID=A0A1V9XYL5_9ACAR|nr:hypothetical protein BIW11_06311 [Tropilaelaps mercedesae]
MSTTIRKNCMDRLIDEAKAIAREKGMFNYTHLFSTESLRMLSELLPTNLETAHQVPLSDIIWKDYGERLLKITRGFAAQLEMADLDFSTDDEEHDIGVGNDSWIGNPPETIAMGVTAWGGRVPKRGRGGRSFRGYRGRRFANGAEATKQVSSSISVRENKRSRGNKRVSKVNSGNVRTGNPLPGARLMGAPGNRP